MQKVYATLSAPEGVITIVAGEDEKFPFDVIIDGVLFDSFMVYSAALQTAFSGFKQAVARNVEYQ
jgi:hypothetical protein